MSFNDYNKNLIKLWSKPRLSMPAECLPQHLFYSNFNIVPFPVIIKNTKQYANTIAKDIKINKVKIS